MLLTLELATPTTHCTQEGRPGKFLTGDALTHADLAVFCNLSTLQSGWLDGIPRDILRDYPGVCMRACVHACVRHVSSCMVLRAHLHATHVLTAATSCGAARVQCCAHSATRSPACPRLTRSMPRRMTTSARTASAQTHDVSDDEWADDEWHGQLSLSSMRG